MSDVELVIIGIISNNITCAKECLKLNQKKLCLLYLNVADSWIVDLQKIRDNNLI